MPGGQKIYPPAFAPLLPGKVAVLLGTTCLNKLPNMYVVMSSVQFSGINDMACGLGIFILLPSLERSRRPSCNRDNARPLRVRLAGSSKNETACSPVHCLNVVGFSRAAKYFEDLYYHLKQSLTFLVTEEHDVEHQLSPLANMRWLTLREPIRWEERLQLFP